MKLRNKAGFWISTDNWSLLKLDQTEVIIRNESNKTYLDKSDDDNIGSGTSVVEKTIVPTSAQVEQDPQKWMIETKENEKHFFKLKHPESGKYLTATSSGGLTIEGNKDH